MSLTVTATPGAANANSYCTVAEADAYYEARLFSDAWDNASAADKNKAVIMATKTLDRMMRGHKTLIPSSSTTRQYRKDRKWTGAPADAVQVLAWPRSGMVDGNGNAVATTVIPAALKNAVAEFAGQMLGGDRTADNDVIVQGLASVNAGVALSFREGLMPQVLPDAVTDELVPSWFTPEQILGAQEFSFDVINARCP